MRPAEWRIPAERMKMQATHIFPLSRQAIEALRELHPLTGLGALRLPRPAHPDPADEREHGQYGTAAHGIR